MTSAFVLKGQTLSFVDNPFIVGPESAVKHHVDGAVLIEDGIIQAVAPADKIITQAFEGQVLDYGDCLITAGFVDCHTHYSQFPIIASYGERLLDWLKRYVFPIERKFNDKIYARSVADFFLMECLRHGITTSSVYATTHKESVDAFFEASSHLGLRMACGKIMMDQNAPSMLCDNVDDSYHDSKELLEKWHGISRNIYAITPRFAPTSSPEQLEAASSLWREYPDVLLQSHLAETEEELIWVAELFPDIQDYFGVYQKFDLVGPGSIFGHGIYLSEREKNALHDSSSSLAHCPASNMFLGSGLFDLLDLKNRDNPITIGLATDIAGGPSLSMFATMRMAYETCQLQGGTLHPACAWYLATIGSAKAMRLESIVGNLMPGMEADITVTDLKSTPLIKQRVAQASNFWDVIFIQIILADDRATCATYSGGNCKFNKYEDI